MGDPTPDPIDIYERDIRPQLERLERQRTGARAGFVLLTMTMLGAVVLSIIKLPFLWKTSKLGKVYLSGAFAIATLPFAYFRNRRKRFFVPFVLKLCQRPDLVYTPKACLSRRQLRHLFKDLKATSVAGEDGITGSRQGITFWFNEVEASRFRYLKGDAERVFRGWLLCLALPQPDAPALACTVDIGPRGASHSMIVLHGKPEDVEQWFTPTLLAQAAPLLALAGTRGIRLTIEEGRFVLALETKRNLFDGIANPNEKLTPQAFAQLMEELNTLTSVVDDLATSLLGLKTTRESEAAMT